MRSTISALILAAALVSVVGFSVQSCASASPRHVATGSVTAVKDALIGVQQTADAAVTAGALSTANRQQLATHLLPALVAAKDVNDTVLNWQPGQPMPANLQTLVANLGGLVHDVAGAFTDAKTQAVVDGYVQAAQSALLLVLSGVQSIEGPSTAAPSAAAGS